ncbi:MFS transporter [Streptomyces sp. NPDC088348]|uniref:MFS transporter n=1 Tax=Streptomyces sp. NPDC088348 TaxID=3365853 RepID=UPI0037F43F0C
MEEARAVVARYIGPNVDFESVRGTPQSETSSSGSYRDLFSHEQWRATTFGILYYNCQVIPYFAIYTFLPVVLAKFAMDESVTVDGLLTGFLFLGSVAGLWCVARFSRRAFVTGSFVVMALALGPMGLWPGGPKLLLFVLFLVFTLVMSAASNLDQVYPPELFPTPLRGSGVGLLNGLSRVGSAIGTFLLPLSIDHLGFATSMTILAGFLVLGAVVSAAWAPETAGAALE